MSRAPEASRLRGWYRSTVPDDARSGLLEFAVLSALMLFWEIGLIRWISTEIRVFAYYKNLSLFACFLGFGVGLLTSKVQEGWRNAIVGRLAFLVALVVIYPVSPLRIDHAPAFFEMFTWHQQAGTIGTTLKFYGVILLVFLATAWAFVPWGRRIGYWFEVLRPIPAYSLNVTANLVGIGLFSLLAVLRTPPLVWVLAGIVPLVLLAGREALRERSLVSLALIPIALTLGQQLTEKAEIHWSPYYKVQVEAPNTQANPAPYTNLKVNHDYHQRLLDLRPAFRATQPPFYEEWGVSYDLPFRVATEGKVGRVLVIGAGTGNDVAAALRAGATEVVAVEIDPVIQSIGKRLHPERPYDSPKVKVAVQDARTYLARPPDPNERFDSVVFGLLDSHTQVSGMNSLRLDYFIYTVESFRQARALLDPGHGVLSVSFSAGWGKSPWTIRRIDRMLLEAFGERPRAAFTGYDAGMTFLAGPGTRTAPYFDTPAWQALSAEAGKRLPPELVEQETLATDDWPFLYLAHRAVPLEYWLMMGLIGLVSVVWVRSSVASFAEEPLALHFFFLGGAFLLIEVRNLISLSLLFGSTWQVNNVAIGAILLMILVANLVAAKFPSISVNGLYAALLLCLVLSAFLGAGSFQTADRALQLVLVPLWLSLPLFIAGLIFISSFAKAESPSAALGANILGGVFGGLLENASLALGIHGLAHLALALYLFSYLALIARRRFLRAV